jgi:hypothetical protein
VAGDGALIGIVTFTSCRSRSRRSPTRFRRTPVAGRLPPPLPSDELTIWYTVTENQDGQVVIVVQYLKADT